MQDPNISTNQQASDIDPLLVSLAGEPTAEADGDLGGDTLEVPDIDVNLIQNHPYYKGLQSKHDQLAAQVQKYQEATNLWDQFDQDQELRNAIVSKYYPDLFKPQNTQESIREVLVKEFGDDFEDKLENGSAFQKMEIQERWRELKEEKKKAYTPPKNFEELIEERRKTQKKAQEDFQKEFEDTVRTFKWDQQTTDRFKQWAGKIRTKDLGYLFNKAIAAQGGNYNPGPITSLPGAPGIGKNKEQVELEKTFGKIPKKPLDFV